MTQAELQQVLGARLKALREARGLTQADVAARMTAHGRPMHKGRLSKLERGTAVSPPSTRDLSAGAAALDTHPALLLLESDPARVLDAYLSGGWPAVLALAASLVK